MLPFPVARRSGVECSGVHLVSGFVGRYGRFSVGDSLFLLSSRCFVLSGNLSLNVLVLEESLKVLGELGCLYRYSRRLSFLVSV